MATIQNYCANKFKKLIGNYLFCYGAEVFIFSDFTGFCCNIPIFVLKFIAFQDNS